MNPDEISWLGDVPIEFEAVVIRSPMRVGEILSLQAGNVVSTQSRVGDSVCLLAGGARIGDGELSTHGGRPLVSMLRLGGKR